MIKLKITSVVSQAELNGDRYFYDILDDSDNSLESSWVLIPFGASQIDTHAQLKNLANSYDDKYTTHIGTVPVGTEIMPD